MIGKLFHAGLLAVALLLASCSKPQSEVEAPPKTAEIKGQVFVIQKNRVNVKMGGVEIHYVPREAFEKQCRWIRDSIPKLKRISGYEKELQRIDTVIEETSHGKHAGKIRDLLSSARERQVDAWKRFDENPLLKDYRLLLLDAEEQRDSIEDAGFGRVKEDHWTLTAFFGAWLSSHATASTQTDADGNYSLALPAAGDGLLFAQSSRQLSKDASESYYWIQKVSSSTPGPIHLSSNTTLSPSNLKDFIGMPPAPDNASMNDLVKEYGLRDLTWFTEAEDLLRQIAEKEDSVAKLKSEAKKVEGEIEKAKYQDMSTQ